MLKWKNIKQDIETYFKPVDQHHRACDTLFNCIQTASVSKYINAMKQLSQHTARITENEILD